MNGRDTLPTDQHFNRADAGLNRTIVDMMIATRQVEKHPLVPSENRVPVPFGSLKKPVILLPD